MAERAGGADLHLHTCFSDGACTPAEVIAAARAAALRTVAITDHDTTDGVLPACAAAGRDLEVVPGVEFSSQAGEDEIHILGLFLPLDGSALEAELRRYQEGRRERIFTICARLAALGLSLAPEEVLEAAGAGAPGRVHVARALVRRGYVRSMGEAFDRYLGNRAPAYVPKLRPTPERAIRLIHEVGGIAVMAHPGLTARDDVVPALVAAQLDGLEAYAPTHSAEQLVRYLALAREHGLVVSAGSDCHGDVKGAVSVGGVRLSDDKLEVLRERAQAWREKMAAGAPRVEP